MGEMDAYRDIFMSESTDYIQGITDGLLALESEPNDLEPVEVVFRGSHSLKGMAAAMGYNETADLTHKMESLMDRVRQRERPADAQLIDLMLEAVDTVKALIDAESGDGSVVDAAPLTARLVAMTDGSTDGDVASEKDSSAQGAASAVEPAAEETLDVSDEKSDEGDGRVLRVAVTLEESCVLKAVRAYMVMKRLSHMGTVIETEPSAREIEDEEFDLTFTVTLRTNFDGDAVRKAVLGVSEIARCSISEVSVEKVDETPGLPTDLPATAKRRAIPKLSETQTVRVSIGHLDTLVNLVGELVILRSRMDRLAANSSDVELANVVEALHRVSGELQHEVMQTRMVPVGNIFNRFPRMVRDLARDLGKEVEFTMGGLEIELDRTVLDEIGDPIVHLLRNGIDHGIGTADERESRGKPRTGKVRLTASREREHVIITVADDGKGIDPEVIWRKAVERGLAEADERAEYSTSDILLFTCVPGFSTAEVATKVSGRGVGMDVVKGKIEHLGGMVSISSAPGQGTTFTLRLPLTLAIIQALMVRTHDNQTFAIPLSSVDEVLDPVDQRIDTVDGAPVTVLRDGRVVPLHRLDVLLGVSSGAQRPPEPGEHIVLVDVAGIPKSLVVNEIVGRQEIVIKPLSRMFRETRGLGGATVLGDGNVALILDPRTMFPTKEDLS